MRYLSIDVETTGLNPETCQVLEIAALVDDLSQSYNPVAPMFHCYVNHPEIRGEPIALAMNARILEVLAGRVKSDVAILSPVEAARQLSRFVREQFGDERVTAAGKNFASFDRPFLDALADATGEPRLRLRHRCFDPGTSFWRPGDTELPDLAKCLERAGILGPLTPHVAVDDAQAVVLLLRHIHAPMDAVRIGDAILAACGIPAPLFKGL